MGAKANPNRRVDIEGALKRVKDGDMLSLEDLAYVWGTTKGPFVTAKKQMVGFPPAILQGTQHIYDGKRALSAMLDYEKRNDSVAADRQKRTDAILGNLTRGRQKEIGSQSIPVRDLQILNRLAIEIEERERIQREYIPAAEVSRVAGDVFSELSEFMSTLSNRVDPNGMLDPGLRKIIDENGSEALLGLHRKLKVLLNADVVDGTSGTAHGRAGKPRPRRKRN